MINVLTLEKGNVRLHFPHFNNDIIKPAIIFVIYHSIFTCLGNDIIKADPVFVMYHSTFKRDETGLVVYSLYFNIMEIIHAIFKLC